MPLYEYQEEGLKQVNELLKNYDKVVLAACPSAGKTGMAAEFIKHNPNKKFLILPHATNFLDDQWKIELEKFDVDFSSKLDPSNKVTLGLPQRFYNKNGYKIDYLIVDEAHEFYLARKKGGKGMVEQIIEKFNPDKILLLTGTPAPFIYENEKAAAKNKEDNKSDPLPYGLHVIPAEKLFKLKYLSDVYMGLVTTTQEFKNSDYNTDGDLKEAIEIVNVPRIMDSLIESMIKRISIIPSLRDKPESILHKLNSKVPVKLLMKMLDKTLIVCKSIKQANHVQEYLREKGVNSLLSHSENDPSSEFIAKFKTDASVPVLIVVGRARLGFDMKTLVNMVDLSCTRNVNVLYQMYARVMRKHPNGFPTKFFFKLVPRDLEVHYKYYTSAALQMVTEEFISSFTGRNLGQMRIYVKGPGAGGGGEDGVGGSGGSKPPVPPIDIFESECGIIQLFMDIKTNMNSEFNEYSKITISEALARLDGKSLNSAVTTEADLEFFALHGEFPEVSLG